MSTIVPKLTDDRTLGQIHAQLMDEITACDNMTVSELKEMCQQLGTLEEVMALKWAVDCDCLYTGKDRQ